MTTWPGRWKGTAARTWLREHLRRWAQREDGAPWRAARRVELGHPFGALDWRGLSVEQRAVALGPMEPLALLAEARSGQRAAIVRDFAACLAELAVPETPHTGTCCHLCGRPASQPHTELSCWQRRAALWETRCRAEAGLPIEGWWLDLDAVPQEMVWFAELPADAGREEPWCVSVWREEPAGPWHWDLSWEPPQSHRSERQIEAGQHVVAWQAMEHALAAWDRRPRGKGVPCRSCYGWGYWCEHGGGPPHPCDDEAACECTACDGGIRAATAAGGQRD